MRLDRSGQSQILMALSVGITMLTAALYALDYAQQSSRLTIRGGMRSEMRKATDAVVAHLSQIYHNDAACDPIQLNERLARLKFDGSVAQQPTYPAAPKFPPDGTADYTAFNRYMDVSLNNVLYRVSVGPVSQVSRKDGQNFINSDTPGNQMDAMVEVWTSRGTIKVLQRAVFINNCSYPCAILDPATGAGVTGFCPPRAAGSGPDYDDWVAYHSILNAPEWPVPSPAAQDQLKTCRGNRRVGSVDTLDCAKSDVINVADLWVLRNYIRNGLPAGTCTDLMLPIGTSGVACPCASGGASATVGSCGDLNGDGHVDEVDLNILEKILRGYLNTSPVHD
ncbi:MAG TPA: dockerin type I domain-containing protein [Bdellovibrionota bacterium]|jgi:hypothetical protein|nr:dockerin type I domain-containing protein [Bdellovibrionota bacterium]